MVLAGPLTPRSLTTARSKKAIKEARLFGHVDVVASSEDANFNYIPKDFSLSREHSYFHLTTNNTIYGTEVHDFENLLNQAKDLEIPVVADMSSDIFSREFDMNQIDLAYAGAQKNLGPAGTTLIIVRKSILGKTNRPIPTLLDYRTHIGKDSMFNTPSVFAVYTSMLTLEWLKENGGLKNIESVNKEKSDKLYEEIDRNALFEGTAARDDRSRMNLTFVCKQQEHQEAFLQAASDAGIVGIKGHRSVGGFRASMYNALTIESVNVLIDLMKDFENKHS
jgi:phosphoserine aminotransferase